MRPALSSTSETATRGRTVATEIQKTTQPENVAITTLPGVFTTERAFVAVPTPDMRAFARDQFIVLGAGFVIGVTVGVLIGNVFDLTRR